MILFSNDFIAGIKRSNHASYVSITYLITMIFPDPKSKVIGFSSNFSIIFIISQLSFFFISLRILTALLNYKSYSIELIYLLIFKRGYLIYILFFN